MISTAFLKDAGDPAWKDDPAMKAWSSFMDKYYPDGDRDDGNAVFGYAAAETLIQVLKQCGDDLRARTSCGRRKPEEFSELARAAGHRDQYRPADFRPIEQMRLVQFDGITWQPIGDVIESAFVGVADK